MQISAEIVEINFEKLEKHVADFINIELMKCRKNNIVPYIPKRKGLLHNGMTCAGYFDEEGQTLAVSYHGHIHKWLSTFVHETCHMDQWLESSTLWKANVDGADPIEILDEWLLGNQNPDPGVLKRAFDIATYIELDCEMRSINKIKKYNLPINTTTYIKKSNAYVWSYRLIQQTREWSHSASYEFPEVWRAMPKHFDNDYSTLPEDISKIFYSNIESFSGII